MIDRKRRHLLVAIVVGAMLATACDSGSESAKTPSASTTTAAAATTTASVTAIASATETSPAANVTSTPAAIATARPPAAGETGIAGIATIGPTCPVERADSPCPDRPYEARITVWRGTTMVAETHSGADGRFSVLVPPGEYRVAGESGSTFPRDAETTVTVVAGHMAEVALRFDSGIR